MRMPGRLRQLLREAVERREPLVLPGCHDALTARIAEASGFSAVYMTGYGTAASLLGMPDVGLLTMSEMVLHANHLASAVGVPVLADGDTGYGNAINVSRTVREYEKAGVAAIQLEDQMMPKKCGHMLGRALISAEEMVGKIKAAVDSRVDSDFVIIARTDARTEFGLEAAIARGHAYAEAGADVLFIESPETPEEMRLITASFKVPVLANMAEGGRTPFRSVSELREIGYQLALYPVSSTYAAAAAVMKVMDALRQTGTTRGQWENMMTFEDFNRFIGLPQIREQEKKYIPAK